MSVPFQQSNTEDTEGFPTFEEALQELNSSGGNLPNPESLYGLAGLTDEQIADFHKVWRNMDASQQHVLLQMMVDAADSNLDMDFEAIGILALKEGNDAVRQTAIELLSESEALETMDVLIHALDEDPSLLVRVGAGRALGNFILLGELGKLSEYRIASLRHQLTSLIESDTEPLPIKAALLESIANCSDKRVAKYISSAYQDDDPDLRISAVIAMGRSCDVKWTNDVMDELENGTEAMQIAAARSAGELQIEEAVPLLARLYANDDIEMRSAVIWSLGEIGGKEALRLLEYAAEEAEDSENDMLIDLIDDAISSASLPSGNLLLGGLDIPLDDD